MKTIIVIVTLCLAHLNGAAQTTMIIPDSLILAVEPSDHLTAIYPVPLSDQLTVDVKDLLDVSIYDTQGKLCILATTNQVPTTDLPPGLYLLKIRTKGDFLSRKVVKL